MKDDNSVDSVVQQLRAHLEEQSPGSRLPSVRHLMATLRVGPGTVQRAVARLAGEGLLDAQPGRGTFVAARRGLAPPADFAWQSAALGPGRPAASALGELVAVPADGVLPLSAGYLSEDLQALPQLAAAMARAVRRPGVWGRIPLDGLETLRLWFARQIGNATHPSDVIIYPGGQAAVATAFRALAAPGEAVLIESPTYLGALAAARAAGLRLVPVPTDARGVDPDALQEGFAASGARVFYCQPTFANPSGSVLAPERRQQVHAIIAKVGAILIEDDWARDLALGAAPPPLASTDRNGHIVYIRSLTKPAAPGLRIAAVTARGAVLSRLRATRTIDDFFVAGVLQEAAVQLVTAPSWGRHLRAVRAALEQRRDALAASIVRRFGADALTVVPGGGLHLWLHLPDAVSDLDIAQRAARIGLLVSAGTPWFPAEPTGSFLRLSFGGAAVDVLERGVEMLAEIARSA